MDGVDRAWWKEAVVYQVYPRSFNDSDGDGVGDIPGIVEKLDYLEALGVDVVWLNPVYESPKVDGGYDVSDYRAIDPEYGDMADWERLLAGLHDRGMRLVMDLVVNHTSDEHPWFLRSRESTGSDYRDYYVWVPGDPGEPPNNWESGFGGSAWTYDERTGEYYLHLFDERQPDLDWTNPEVREEVYDMMTWWFEKGIDGFRLDVVNLLSKPRDFPDGDPDSGWVGVDQFADGPRIDEYLGEMRERVFDEYDCMTVGETIGADVETGERYAGPGGPLDLIFHFQHVTLDYGEEGWWEVRDWDLPELKEVFTRWQTGFDGWNAVYLGNHDQPRIVSRFGDDGEYRRESAKLLATLLLTLRGTPFIYQGDELGMTNYPFEHLGEMEDAQTVGNVEAAIEAGEIEGFEEVRDLARYWSRDNARTPMQWSAAEHAGFSAGEPWLPVNPNYPEVNVEAERARGDSVLSYYRELVDLRHDWDLLVYGEYDLLVPDHEQVYAYTRTLGEDRALVVLNVSADDVTVDPGVEFDGAKLVTANYPVEEPTDAPLSMEPYGARVYRL